MRSWREQKILLRLWFPILEDKDLDFEIAERESMLLVLGDKLNKSRPELDHIFEELQKH